MTCLCTSSQECICAHTQDIDTYATNQHVFGSSDALNGWSPGQIFPQSKLCFEQFSPSQECCMFMLVLRSKIDANLPAPKDKEKQNKAIML